MTNISLKIPPFNILHDFRNMIIMHKFVLDHSLKQLNNVKLGGQSLNRTIFYDLKCPFNIFQSLFWPGILNTNYRKYNFRFLNINFG